MEWAEFTDKDQLSAKYVIKKKQINGLVTLYEVIVFNAHGKPEMLFGVPPQRYHDSR